MPLASARAALAGAPAPWPGPGSAPPPAPWPEAPVHDDTPEPVRVADDELARDMLRILIAEARREGLEL